MCSLYARRVLVWCLGVTIVLTHGLVLLGCVTDRDRTPDHFEGIPGYTAPSIPSCFATWMPRVLVPILPMMSMTWCLIVSFHWFVQ